MDELVKGKADNGLSVWVPEHAIRGYMPPSEKVIQEKIDRLVTAKAEIRSQTCWQDGCTHPPRVWVREVQFDLFKLGTAATLSGVSTDYTGPIPGLCVSHENTGIEQLVGLVYKQRPEIQWGYLPSRARVVFTDGSKTELLCDAFESKTKVATVDEHTKGDANGNS